MSDNGILELREPREIWRAHVEVPEWLRYDDAYREYDFAQNREWYLEFVELSPSNIEINYGADQIHLDDKYIAAYEEFRDAIFKHYQPELERRVAEVRKYSTSDVVNAKGVIGKSIAPEVDLPGVGTIRTRADVVYSAYVCVPGEIADNPDYSEVDLMEDDEWDLNFMISETGKAYLLGDHFSELEGHAAVEKEVCQALLEYYRSPLEQEFVRIAEAQNVEWISEPQKAKPDHKETARRLGLLRPNPSSGLSKPGERQQLASTDVPVVSLKHSLRNDIWYVAEASAALNDVDMNPTTGCKHVVLTQLTDKLISATTKPTADVPMVVLGEIPGQIVIGRDVARIGEQIEIDAVSFHDAGIDIDAHGRVAENKVWELSGPNADGAFKMTFCPSAKPDHKATARHIGLLGPKPPSGLSKPDQRKQSKTSLSM